MYIFFLIFFIYSFIYHWYPYHYPWLFSDVPTAPFYILISRDIFFIVLLLFYFYRIAWDNFKLKGLDRRPVIFVLGCYFLLMIVLMLGAFHIKLADFLQHNMRNLLMYALIIPVYFYVAETYNDNFASKLAKIFVVMGAGLSLFGIITFIAFDKSLLWGGVRVYSLMGNPNTFGLFLLIPGLIAWAMILLDDDFKNRLILGSAVVLNIIALILTVSFQSVMSFIIAISLTAILIKKWRALIPVGGMVALGAIAYFIIVDHFPAFFYSLAFKINASESTSIAGRIDQLAYVVGCLKGIGNWFVGEIGRYEYARFDSQYHNIIINNGLLALMLYLVPPVYTVYLGLKYKKRICSRVDPWTFSMFIAGLVFLMVVTFFTANLTAFMQRYPINMYFYLLMAMVLYLTRKGAYEQN